jgi:hypothetical protein
MSIVRRLLTDRIDGETSDGERVEPSLERDDVLSAQLDRTSRAEPSRAS